LSLLWSREQKREIVAGTWRAWTTVPEVGRRHGVDDDLAIERDPEVMRQLLVDRAT